MPEHYSKAVVQVSVWCKVCHKDTMHRVDSGRRGPCLECLAKNEAECLAKREAAARRPGSLRGEQMDLFR